MNSKEYKMCELLQDLKAHHKLSGIKISFEDEGLSGEQAQIISSLAFKSGVSVSLKIGGCEAKKDLREAKILGVDKVVAPMIESAYAMQKFVLAAKKIYTQDELLHTKLMINIETVSGYKCLEEIFNTAEADALYGIVLGRSDFSGSLKKDKSFVNSDVMYEYASNMADLCVKYDKKFYVGGNLTNSSVEFFKRLSQHKLDGFETRNIIFSGEEIKDRQLDKAISKALQFELLWLQDKCGYSDNLTMEDKERIENIQTRLNKQILKHKQDYYSRRNKESR